MKFLFSWKGLVIAIIILIVLVLIMIDVRVNGYTRYDRVNEFDFELRFGTYGMQNVNTFEDTITKDLIMSGTMSSDYVFPEYAKRHVYKMLRDMDIMNFPSRLELPYVDAEKTNCLTLNVVIDGAEKTVECLVPWGYKLRGVGTTPDQLYQFLTLTEYIENRVYKSGEWRDLPKSVGGYL